MMRLEEYAGRIALRDVLERPEPFSTAEETDGALQGILEFLIGEEGRDRPIPPGRGGRRRLLRALLNGRAPMGLPDVVMGNLDRLLWMDRLEAGIIRPEDVLPMRDTLGTKGRHGDALALWHGDIVRLGADAIVNAANADLLGCFQPLHACIDNAVHSAAGPRLRGDCAAIMALQGEPEAAGRAKITRAYSLPARFVLHTVGPIVRGPLTDRHRETLASCYTACLDLSAEAGGVDSVAFCGISTGVFGFPADEAAPIAVAAVSDWLDDHPGRIGKILFDVFSVDDLARYRRAFQG